MYTISKEEKQTYLFEQLKGLAIMQARMLGLDYTCNENCATISNQFPCEKTMTDTFISPAQAIQIQQNLDSAKEAFASMALRMQNKILETDYKEELLFKAFGYNIPYNPYTINFLELEQQIDEYESLLHTAQEYGIDWDSSEYDPIALQQEIDYHERQEIDQRNLMYLDYISSRAIQI